MSLRKVAPLFGLLLGLAPVGACSTNHSSPSEGPGTKSTQTNYPPGTTPWVPADEVRAASLTGAAKGAGYELTVVPGPIATKAIRVVSQPSNTLLAVFVESKFSETAEGQSWLAGIVGTSGAPVVKADLPTSGGTTTIAGRPANDKAAQLWVYGNWPAKGEVDKMIADAVFSDSGMGLDVMVKKDGSDDPDYWCSGGSCGQFCTHCAGTKVYCCIPDCTISCAPQTCGQ